MKKVRVVEYFEFESGCSIFSDDIYEGEDIKEMGKIAGEVMDEDEEIVEGFIMVTEIV